MKRLLLYPFTTDMLPFVLHIYRQKNFYKLAAVCGVSGSGLIGKDIGFSWNLDDVGIQVSADPLKHLECCDTVCILPHTNLDVSELVKLASDLGKEVLDYSEDLRTDFIPEKERKLLENFEKLGAKTLLEFETPIIEVGGLIETPDKDQITLSLMDDLREKGLTVSVLSLHNFIHFCGGYNINFICASPLSSSTVTSLNHFIRAIEIYEKPDIVIVQAPGNFFRYNNQLIGDLGISAFLFSQAFVPDYFISSIMLGIYNSEFWNMLGSSMENRFGFPLDAVHISNKTLIPDLSEEEGKMSFYKNPINTVREIVKRNRKYASFQVGNFFEIKDREPIIQNIFQKLTAVEENI